MSYGNPPAHPYPSYGQQPPPGYGQQPPAYAPAGMPPAYPGASPYASWGSRVGATLIDALIPLGIVIFGLIVMLILISTEESGLVAVGVVIGVACYLGAIGFQIWNYAVRQGRTGCTIGKKALGIRLVRETTGQPLGGWISLGRMMIHGIDAAVLCLGYLWPLWDDKRQTWTDKLMLTVVVRQPEPPHK